MGFELALLCDGIACTARYRDPHAISGALLRRDLERLRRLAAADGWTRVRPRRGAPQGDYCRACTERLRAE